MIEEIRRLTEMYHDWLRDRTVLREIDDWVEVTTPFLDRHNDCLQIYVKRENGGFLLTDDGYIVMDLEHTGCKLDSPRRQHLLNMTLNGFGVRINEKALEVRASEGSFALRKHSLVQAMLAVNDLFCLASPSVSSLFYDDVVAWLDLSDIRYTPNVQFTGRSGYGHRFDFVIPKSKAKPERILRAFNRANRDAAQAMAFSWIDIKEVRAPESSAYAILNDSERTVSEGVVDAMRNYDIRPVPWSERDRMRDELTA